MCEDKKECPTARMLRVPQSTRWDSDLVDRMFADLPFKPCDTSLQSSNRVDDLSNKGGECQYGCRFNPGWIGVSGEANRRRELARIRKQHGISQICAQCGDELVPESTARRRLHCKRPRSAMMFRIPESLLDAAKEKLRFFARGTRHLGESTRSRGEHCRRRSFRKTRK